MKTTRTPVNLVWCRNWLHILKDWMQIHITYPLHFLNFLLFSILTNWKFEIWMSYHIYHYICFHSDEDEVFPSSGTMASFPKYQTPRMGQRSVRPIDAPVSGQEPEWATPAWSMSTFDEWSHWNIKINIIYGLW